MVTEIYRDYLDKIDGLANAIRLLSGGKEYIKNEDLTSENLMTILQATSEFINSILKKERAIGLKMQMQQDRELVADLQR